MQYPAHWHNDDNGGPEYSFFPLWFADSNGKEVESSGDYDHELA